MRHREARKLFSAAIDGELSERKARQLEEHLAGCRECRAEFALHERSSQLLSAGEAAEMSNHFTERLIERLREERERHAAVSECAFARHALLAAGAAALLLLFLWGDRVTGFERPTPAVYLHGERMRSWTP